MRKLSKGGMTLIEVVVAIAIFGIVMVTIFPAVLVLNLMNTYSYEKLDATFIAQEAMEAVIFESRENTLANVRAELVNMSYVFQSDISNSTTYVYLRTESNYSITITLSQVDETRLYNLLVVVTSATNDIAGQRAQLETLVALD